MSVSVCVSVFVYPRAYLWNYTSDLPQIFCACYLWPWLDRSSSGVVLIRYVLPVLWMTSYFLISQGCSLDVAAQLKRSAHAALGLAIKCAQ